MKQVYSSIYETINELESKNLFKQSDSLRSILVKLVTADLRDWFQEKWVDVRRKKKDGRYQPCGRGDTSKGKKPVCAPVNKAKNLSKKERTQRMKEKSKKEREPNPDKKPNVTQYSEGAGGKSNIS
jgi:predicted transcriptional regulator